MASGTIPSNQGIAKSLGTAGTSGATLTLPDGGNNYLLFTGHNSYTDIVSFWYIRPSGNLAVHLGGGTNLTITVSNRDVTITTGRGSVTVTVIRLS